MFGRRAPEAVLTSLPSACARCSDEAAVLRAVRRGGPQPSKRLCDSVPSGAAGVCEREAGADGK